MNTVVSRLSKTIIDGDPVSNVSVEVMERVVVEPHIETSVREYGPQGEEIPLPYALPLHASHS